jgi:hypothetical protein
MGCPQLHDDLVNIQLLLFGMTAGLLALTIAVNRVGRHG